MHMYYNCIILFIPKCIPWVNYIIIILQVKKLGKNVKEYQNLDLNPGNCEEQTCGTDNHRKYHVLSSHLVFADIF